MIAAAEASRDGRVDHEELLFWVGSVHNPALLILLVGLRATELELFGMRA